MVQQVGSLNFSISENLGQKASPDDLSSVDGYNCRPTIGVAQEMMAALYANDLETKTP